MKATAIILAAGEGTRMKSDLPKVAHEILGVPMVRHVVEKTRNPGLMDVVVVTGHGAEIVESLLSDLDVDFARQNEQLGTGHAVMCALEKTGDLAGPVLVLAGDVPLVRAETISMLVAEQSASKAACVMLSAMFPDPTGYGRVIRDEAGKVTGIIEHKDLPADLLGVREGNVGIYCFDGEALSAHLHRIETSNAQGEYYLTDLVGLFVEEGLEVLAVATDDPNESLGINSRSQLAQATAVMQREINERHMVEGVTMTAPDLVWIGPHVELGRDVVIEPMTFLYGETRVADGARIGPNTRITDSQIGAAAEIDSSVVVGAVVGPGATVGPVAYLRPGTVLGRGAKVGASVEIKNSTVGEGSKVPHLS
ncbi:UDP-N-acetylglucosamine diphosphorylase/glucosamine-1-phosphate N-acetyltransferase, partial [bacterium]|nr:UDP-N-acetylglucosamine diphosphorylase/glucosamine-1-phosphate N-acetyltransferase [bacterium]